MNAPIKHITGMSVRTKVIKEIIYHRDGKQHIISEANAKKIMTLRKVIVKCYHGKITTSLLSPDIYGFTQVGVVAKENVSIKIKYRANNVSKWKYTVYIGERIEFELNEEAFKNLYKFIKDTYKEKSKCCMIAKSN